MYEDLLACVPLFAELTRRELGWLADACREREYVTGDTLICQGGGGVGLFLLMDGRVRLTAPTDDGREQEFGRLGVGAVWGEDVLLEDRACLATVWAAEPTRALVLPIWDFRATLRDFPDLAIHLLAILGRQLRPPTGYDPSPLPHQEQADRA
jgi:CRP/FNR family transcriptional regulator